MNRVVVIGSSNMDLITMVPDLPKPGETIIAERYTHKHGGKGGNQAVAARRAGAEVMLVTALGDDGFGTQLSSSYGAMGIDLSHVYQSQLSTGIALINISQLTGENSITVVSGANADLHYNHVQEALEEIDYDIIVLQNEIPKETIRSIVANKDGDKKVLYNPAPYINIENLELSKIDVLVVNETECAQLLELNDFEILPVDKLKKLLIDHVIVTLGEKGCLYVNNVLNVHTQIDAFPADVLDTTGAGDTFCGYFSAVIEIESSDHTDAIREAMAAASIAISQIGAQEAMPTRAEVLKLI